MIRSRTFRFGLYKNFSRKFTGNKLHTICQLSDDEWFGCTNREMYYIPRSRPPEPFPYSISACQLIPSEDVIVAVTSGIPAIIFLAARSGFPKISEEYRLPSAFVSQLIVSPSTNSIILAGSGVNIYDFRIKRERNALKPTIDLVLRVAIPSEEFGSHVCKVYFDEKRRRIFVPTLTGYRLYTLSGVLLQSTDRLHSLPFRTACCIHDDKKIPERDKLIDPNYPLVQPFKKFMATDGDGTIRIWRPSGKLEKSITTSSRSFIFTEFISSEFVIAVTATNSIMLIDVKTEKYIHFMTLPNTPDAIALFNSRTLSLIVDNEMIIYDISVPLELWTSVTSQVKQIKRYPSAHSSSRIVTSKHDNVFDMFFPDDAQLLCNVGLPEADNIKSMFYDRGCFVSDGKIVTYDWKCTDRLFLLIENDSLCEMKGSPNGFTLVEHPDVKGKAMTLATSMKQNKICVCLFTKRGELCLFDPETFVPITRITLEEIQPLYCFFHATSDSLVIVYPMKIVQLSFDNYQVISSEPVAVTVLADFNDDLLILATENDQVLVRQITKDGIVYVESIHSDAKVVCVNVQYGLFAFANEKGTVIFGRSLEEAVTIEVPFPVYAVGFLNNDLDLLIGLDHEIMISKRRSTYWWIQPAPAMEMDSSDMSKEPLLRRSIEDGSRVLNRVSERVERRVSKSEQDPRKARFKKLRIMIEEQKKAREAELEAIKLEDYREPDMEMKRVDIAEMLLLTVAEKEEPPKPEQVEPQDDAETETEEQEGDKHVEEPKKKSRRATPRMKARRSSKAVIDGAKLDDARSSLHDDSKITKPVQKKQKPIPEEKRRDSVDESQKRPEPKKPEPKKSQPKKADTKKKTYVKQEQAPKKVAETKEPNTSRRQKKEETNNGSKLTKDDEVSLSKKNITWPVDGNNTDTTEVITFKGPKTKRAPRNRQSTTKGKQQEDTSKPQPETDNQHNEAKEMPKGESESILSANETENNRDLLQMEEEESHEFEPVKFKQNLNRKKSPQKSGREKSPETENRAKKQKQKSKKTSHGARKGNNKASNGEDTESTKVNTPSEEHETTKGRKASPKNPKQTKQSCTKAPQQTTISKANENNTATVDLATSEMKYNRTVNISDVKDGYMPKWDEQLPELQKEQPFDSSCTHEPESHVQQTKQSLTPHDKVNQSDLGPQTEQKAPESGSELTKPDVSNDVAATQEASVKESELQELHQQRSVIENSPPIADVVKEESAGEEEKEAPTCANEQNEEAVLDKATVEAVQPNVSVDAPLEDVRDEAVGETTSGGIQDDASEIIEPGETQVLEVVHSEQEKQESKNDPSEAEQETEANQSENEGIEDKKPVKQEKQVDEERETEELKQMDQDEKESHELEVSDDLKQCETPRQQTESHEMTQVADSTSEQAASDEVSQTSTKTEPVQSSIPKQQVSQAETPSDVTSPTLVQESHESTSEIPRETAKDHCHEQTVPGTRKLSTEREDAVVQPEPAVAIVQQDTAAVILQTPTIDELEPKETVHQAVELPPAPSAAPQELSASTIKTSIPETKKPAALPFRTTLQQPVINSETPIVAEPAQEQVPERSSERRVPLIPANTVYQVQPPNTEHTGRPVEPVKRVVIATESTNQVKQPNTLRPSTISAIVEPPPTPRWVKALPVSSQYKHRTITTAVPEKHHDRILYDTNGKVVVPERAWTFFPFGETEIGGTDDKFNIHIVYDKNGNPVGFVETAYGGDVNIDFDKKSLASLSSQDFDGYDEWLRDANGNPVMAEDGHFRKPVSEWTAFYNEHGDPVKIGGVSVSSASLESHDSPPIIIHGFRHKVVHSRDGKTTLETTYQDENGNDTDLVITGFMGDVSGKVRFYTMDETPVDDVFDRNGDPLIITGVHHSNNMFDENGNRVSQTIFSDANGNALYLEGFTPSQVYDENKIKIPQMAKLGTEKRVYTYGSLASRQCHPAYYDDRGKPVKMSGHSRVALFQFCDIDGRIYRRKIVYDENEKPVGYVQLQEYKNEGADYMKLLFGTLPPDYNPECDAYTKVLRGRDRKGNDVYGSWMKIPLPGLRGDVSRENAERNDLALRAELDKEKIDPLWPPYADFGTGIYDLMAMRKIAYETSRRVRGSDSKPLGNIEMAMKVFKPKPARNSKSPFSMCRGSARAITYF